MINKQINRIYKVMPQIRIEKGITSRNNTITIEFENTYYQIYVEHLQEKTYIRHKGKGQGQGFFWTDWEDLGTYEDLENDFIGLLIQGLEYGY